MPYIGIGISILSAGVTQTPVEVTYLKDIDGNNILDIDGNPIPDL